MPFINIPKWSFILHIESWKPLSSTRTGTLVMLTETSPEPSHIVGTQKTFVYWMNILQTYTLTPFPLPPLKASHSTFHIWACWYILWISQSGKLVSTPLPHSPLPRPNQTYSKLSSHCFNENHKILKESEDSLAIIQSNILQIKKPKEGKWLSHTARWSQDQNLILAIFATRVTPGGLASLQMDVCSLSHQQIMLIPIVHAQVFSPPSLSSFSWSTDASPIHPSKSLPVPFFMTFLLLWKVCPR